MNKVGEFVLYFFYDTSINIALEFPRKPLVILQRNISLLRTEKCLKKRQIMTVKLFDQSTPS